MKACPLSGDSHHPTTPSSPDPSAGQLAIWTHSRWGDCSHFVHSHLLSYTKDSHTGLASTWPLGAEREERGSL